MKTIWGNIIVLLISLMFLFSLRPVAMIMGFVVAVCSSFLIYRLIVERSKEKKKLKSEEVNPDDIEF